MKLIVDELGIRGTNEVFQEVKTGTSSRFVSNIRPHLYRHNSPSGSLRIDVRDLNDEIAKSSNAVAISAIDPGNNFFHGIKMAVIFRKFFKELIFPKLFALILHGTKSVCQISKFHKIQ